MPRYHRVESFSTFALRPRRRRRRSRLAIERAGIADLPAIAECLQQAYRKRQFAPLWRAEDLADDRRCPGIEAADFFVLRSGRGIAACVAVWDQRRLKQIVVRGYPAWLGPMRPLANLTAAVFGAPRLPAVGEALRHIYLSHLAVDDNPAVFLALVRSGLDEAARRGAEAALVGLASRHPFAPLLRRRAREYRTVLHLVDWNDSREPAPIDARLPHVEIAVM